MKVEYVENDNSSPKIYLQKTNLKNPKGTLSVKFGIYMHQMTIFKESIK
jgi:hypothetical protein